MESQSMMKLVPYHILEVKKELFLYVTSLCQFYRIDIPTAEFLNLCLEHSFEEAKERFIKLGACRTLFEFADA